jgi:hypothetical protein
MGRLLFYRWTYISFLLSSSLCHCWLNPEYNGHTIHQLWYSWEQTFKSKTAECSWNKICIDLLHHQKFPIGIELQCPWSHCHVGKLEAGRFTDVSCRKLVDSCVLLIGFSILSRSENLWKWSSGQFVGHNHDNYVPSLHFCQHHWQLVAIGRVSYMIWALILL